MYLTQVRELLDIHIRCMYFGGKTAMQPMHKH